MLPVFEFILASYSMLTTVLKCPHKLHITFRCDQRLIYLIAARRTQYNSTQIKTLPVKHDLYMKLATGANSRRQQRFISFNPIRCIKHISIHSYIYHFTSESYIKAQWFLYNPLPTQLVTQKPLRHTQTLNSHLTYIYIYEFSFRFIYYTTIRLTKQRPAQYIHLSKVRPIYIFTFIRLSISHSHTHPHNKHTKTNRY